MAEVTHNTKGRVDAETIIIMKRWSLSRHTVARENKNRPGVQIPDGTLSRLTPLGQWVPLFSIPQLKLYP